MHTFLQFILFFPWSGLNLEGQSEVLNSDICCLETQLGEMRSIADASKDEVKRLKVNLEMLQKDEEDKTEEVNELTQALKDDVRQCCKILS